MPDSKLTVLIVAHSIYPSIFSQKESVKDSTRNLLDILVEGYRQRGRHLFWLVNSQLPILIWSTSIDLSQIGQESSVHGSTRDLSEILQCLSWQLNFSRYASRFKLSGSKCPIISQSPWVKLAFFCQCTHVRKPAFNADNLVFQRDLDRSIKAHFIDGFGGDAEPAIQIGTIGVHRPILCEERNVFFRGA